MKLRKLALLTAALGLSTGAALAQEKTINNRRLRSKRSTNVAANTPEIAALKL